MCINCGTPDYLPCSCQQTKQFCTTCHRDTECDVKIKAECVFYHLDDDIPSALTCLGIPNKVDLSTIIEQLSEKLCDYQFLQTPIAVVDTNSVNLTASGSFNTTLQADVRIDPDVDNALVVSSNGLFVPNLAASDLTFDNALTNTANNVQLGGPLVKNTNIGLSTFTLQLDGSFGSFIKANNQNLQSRLYAGTGSSDVVSDFNQTPALTEIRTGVYSDVIGGGGYYTKNLLSLKNAGGDTILGSSYPVGGGATIDPTAYFRTRPYKATVEANQISLTVPLRIIGAGTIISGQLYKINTNTGGADFTPSGAPNNTVGTIFVSNGVTPTWGSGSLEVMGFVDLTINNAEYLMQDGSHVFRARNGQASPFDMASISILQPNDVEFTIYKETQYALRQFISEGVVSVISSSDTTRYAKMGVSVPITLDTGILPPAATQYTSYTSWENAILGITQGNMKTVSAYVSFVGPAVFNSGYTSFGINTTLPTTSLDIDGPSTGASLRIRKNFTPANTAAAGNPGDIAFDANYMYRFVVSVGWKRSPIFTTF